MALTNGADHSDYQVRTWFVLFAPNPPSCRPDKEGRALSYTVFSSDWRPLGPSDWDPGLFVWLRTKAFSKGLKGEPPSMKLSREKYQEFRGTFSYLKYASWIPALLLGIVFQLNSNLCVSELGTISDRGNWCNLQYSSSGGPTCNICNCLILTPDRNILEYLSGFLLLVASSDTRAFLMDVEITRNLLLHPGFWVSPKISNQ